MNDASSLSTRQAASILWDVVVIGAGPAGAVIACHLARQQRRVLLVESKAFPRDKVCGGCLSRRALGELLSAGLGELSRSLPGRPITEYEIRWSGRSFVVVRDGGLSVSRALLDDRLLMQARAYGVEVLTKTTARVLSRENHAAGDSTLRHVLLDQAGERGAVVHSRLVIAADGLNRRSLRDLTDFPVRTASDSWVGLHAILPLESDWPPPGRIVMAAAPGGYVGAVRIEPALGETAERVNIAAALSRFHLSRRAGPVGAVMALFGESGTVIPAALATATWSGTGPLTRTATILAHDRVVVLGDAAGYVEPFTGEGVASAIAGANALAELLADQGELWTDDFPRKWTPTYRRRVTRGRWLIQTIRAAVHRPWLTATAFQLATRFPAFPAFVARQINTGWSPGFSRPWPHSGDSPP